MSSFKYQSHAPRPKPSARVFAAVLAVVANIVVVGGVLSLFADLPTAPAIAAGPRPTVTASTADAAAKAVTPALRPAPAPGPAGV